MKLSLRRGDCTHFNIYSLNPRSASNGDIVVGWATRIGGCASDVLYDGAVVAYYALDGFDDPFYGEGDTVIHESGHWCNLFDEDGCGGDYSVTCETNNFMDCSQDVCREQFNSEQLATMDADLCSGRGMCRTGQNEETVPGSDDVNSGQVVEVQPASVDGDGTDAGGEAGGTTNSGGSGGDAGSSGTSEGGGAGNGSGQEEGQNTIVDQDSSSPQSI